MESAANQTEHFADVAVRENVVYGYEVVTALFTMLACTVQK